MKTKYLHSQIHRWHAILSFQWTGLCLCP